MTGVRAVTSNQDDIYKNLEQVVRKYAATRFLRPVADHTREAFDDAKKFVQNFYQSHPELVSGSALAVILDSGCGTGESTLHLARRFPGVPVIGIDKSAIRLSKAGNVHQLRHADESQSKPSDLGMTGGTPSNAFWVRAELLDFWRLALEEQQAGRWHILHHAVFYPNPWPKESEATRRFHLHPIFPTMMALGDVTELRTNWEIYAREFAEASRILTECHPELLSGSADADQRQHDITIDTFNPEFPETAFERKYKEARQQLWRVLVKKF